jgi:hypothetical protein
MIYGENSSDTFYTKGMIIPLDGDADVLCFGWNPKAIIEDKKIKWQHLRVAGREQPFQQYGCGEPRVFIFPFSISRSNGADDAVNVVKEALYKFTKPTAGGTVKRPPLCQVILGAAYNITCFVRDIKFQSEEFYNPISLYPTSCEAVLSVEEVLLQ